MAPAPASGAPFIGVWYYHRHGAIARRGVGWVARQRGRRARRDAGAPLLRRRLHLCPPRLRRRRDRRGLRPNRGRDGAAGSLGAGLPGDRVGAEREGGGDHGVVLGFARKPSPPGARTPTTAWPSGWGATDWYASYALRVCCVERASRFDHEQAPSRLSRRVALTKYTQPPPLAPPRTRFEAREPRAQRVERSYRREPRDVREREADVERLRSVPIRAPRGILLVRVEVDDVRRGVQERQVEDVVEERHSPIDDEDPCQPSRRVAQMAIEAAPRRGSPGRGS